MHQELCPFCGTLRDMDLTAYQTIKVREDGKEDHTVTVVFYCRYCGLFVRSEDVKEEIAEAA